MKLVAILYFGALVFVGCASSAQDPVECRSEITALEDSISNRSLQLQLGEHLDSSMMNRLKDKLIHYYQTFPDNEYAPEYLDKLHMLAIGERDYATGMCYADTLIKQYKDYINRPMILESMANAYDMFIQPRDIEKVKYYNNLLLKENPQMDKDKRAEIEYRLEHIDLTIDELIDLQIESANEN